MAPPGGQVVGRRTGDYFAVLIAFFSGRSGWTGKAFGKAGEEPTRLRRSLLVVPLIYGYPRAEDRAGLLPGCSDAVHRGQSAAGSRDDLPPGERSRNPGDVRASSGHGAGTGRLRTAGERKWD